MKLPSMTTCVTVSLILSVLILAHKIDQHTVRIAHLESLESQLEQAKGDIQMNNKQFWNLWMQHRETRNQLLNITGVPS